MKILEFGYNHGVLFLIYSLRSHQITRPNCIPTRTKSPHRYSIYLLYLLSIISYLHISSFFFLSSSFCLQTSVSLPLIYYISIFVWPSSRLLSNLSRDTYIGKVCMDRNSPDFYVETTQDSLTKTEDYIKYVIHELKSDLVTPVITPR